MMKCYKTKFKSNLFSSLILLSWHLNIVLPSISLQLASHSSISFTLTPSFLILFSSSFLPHPLPLPFLPPVPSSPEQKFVVEVSTDLHIFRGLRHDTSHRICRPLGSSNYKYHQITSLTNDLCKFMQINIIFNTKYVWISIQVRCKFLPQLTYIVLFYDAI